MKAAVKERKVIGKAIITPIGAEALSAVIEEVGVCIILIEALQAKHASLIKRFLMLMDAAVARNAIFARFDPELQPAVGLSIAHGGIISMHL
jgi:hypothetical protein